MSQLPIVWQQILGPNISRRLLGILTLLGLMAGQFGCHWRSLPDSEATGKPQGPTTPPTKTINSSKAVPALDPETTGKPQSLSSPPTQSAYSLEDQRALLRLARSALNRAVREGKLEDLPARLPGHLLVKNGCFVTLTIAGQLRGCIGNIFAERPLAEAVIHNARSAALEDSRFSPVTVDELKSILVEVSVLSIPEPLEFSSPEDLLNKLHPHRDGVVLSVGLRRATFLPQVWEQLPDTREFLEHLATKAGLAADAWRRPNLKILIYHADAFKESGSGFPPPEADLPADRLHEHVDGAEPMLQSLGCRRLLFWHLSNPSVDLEIMVFNTEAGARTALDKDSGSARSRGVPGDEGWTNQQVVYFRRGASYCRLIANQQPPVAGLSEQALRVDKALASGEIRP